MSFFSNIAKFFSGNSLGGTLLKTAISAYALNRLTASINRDNASKTEDKGTLLQLDPDPTNKIPVIYGKTTVGGSITDVVLAADNKTIWVCLTLSEHTGNKIDGTASTITFSKVFMDGFEINFKNDGVTAEYLFDVDGNQDPRVDGLIEIYCYSNGSTNQVFPTGYSGTTATAYSRFPNWNTTKLMSNLVFAIVKVTYDAEQKVTNFPNFRFTLNNSMDQPGDCMYDFMTSTRYGCGIPATEIYSI